MKKLRDYYLWSLLQRGNIYFSTGYFEKGVNDLLKILNIAKNKKNPYYLKALYIKYVNILKYKQNYNIVEKEVSKILKQINNKKDLYFKFLDLLALIKTEKGEHNEAIKIYNSILNKRDNDKYSIIDIYGKIAINYYLSGNIHKALQFQKKAYKFSDEMTDKRIKLIANSRMGVILFGLGHYNEALKYITSSYKLSKDIGFPMHQLKALNNLGIIYYKLGEFNKAIVHYKKYLAISQKIGYERGFFNTYLNIGVSYKNLNQINRAIKYYKKALNNAEKSGNLKYILLIYINLASFYLELGDYPKAKFYIYKAYLYAIKLNDKKNMLYILDNIFTINFFEDKNEKILKIILDKEENLIQSHGLYNMDISFLKNKCLYFQYVRDYSNFFDTLYIMLKKVKEEKLSHHIKTIIQLLNLVKNKKIRKNKKITQNIIREIKEYMIKNHLSQDLIEEINNTFKNLK